MTEDSVLEGNTTISSAIYVWFRVKHFRKCPDHGFIALDCCWCRCIFREQIAGCESQASARRRQISCHSEQNIQLKEDELHTSDSSLSKEDFYFLCFAVCQNLERSILLFPCHDKSKYILEHVWNGTYSKICVYMRIFHSSILSGKKKMSRNISPTAQSSCELSPLDSRRRVYGPNISIRG